MSEAPVTLEELRSVDLFESLDDTELAEWVTLAHTRHVNPGGIIAEQGEEPPGLQLLLEGRAQALILAQGRSEPVGHHTAPTWMGAIAVLTGGTLGVRMQAETDCRMATVAPEDFKRLAFAQPEIHQRVMRQVAPVMSRVTEREQNSERLTSLGTMAAGLAHELNNPAAAARRAAAQMTEALEAIDSALASFVEAGVEREDAALLVGLQQQAISQAASATALDALDAADAEDELLEQMQAMGVAEPWRLAEPLASAGVDRQWLGRLAELAGPATDAALRWVAASLTAGRLSAELCESTERMSSLVGAVKSYAYMDRGALVEVNLHEGLETTLTVLSYKLKHTTIALVRDYDRALPKLTVRGSSSTRCGRTCSTTRSTPWASGERSRSQRARTATARLSRSPMTVLAFQRIWPGASSTRSSRPRTWVTVPAWGWRPRDGSWSSATTARLRSTANPAAQPFVCGCPSAKKPDRRIRCQLAPTRPDRRNNARLYTPGTDPDNRAA